MKACTVNCESNDTKIGWQNNKTFMCMMAMTIKLSNSYRSLSTGKFLDSQEIKTQSALKRRDR